MVHLLVPFLPAILIFVYFCLKVDEENDLLFFVQTLVNCYYIILIVSYDRSLLN